MKDSKAKLVTNVRGKPNEVVVIMDDLKSWVEDRVAEQGWADNVRVTQEEG